MNSGTALLAFFSGGICLLRGINKLVEPAAGKKEGAIAVFCISVGLVNLQLYFFVLVPSRPLYPLIGTLPLPFFKFLVGPALLLYVQSAFHQNGTFRFSEMLHFFPAFASIALLLLTGVCSGGLPFAEDLCNLVSLARLRVWYDVVGQILALVYLVWIAIDIEILSLLSGRLRDLESAIFAGIVVIMIAVAALVVGGHLFRSQALALRALQVTSIAIVLWSTILARVPELERRVGRRVREVRSARRQKKGHPPAEIVHRIEELMHTERIFLDDEITLNSVASLIPTPSHQLSRVINDRFGMNFNAYVNMHRVREARRLLESKPGMSVLAVGYSVGFNSKSAFYNAFKREYGITPGMFRSKARS